MPLEFTDEGTVFRVDGDVLEVFSRGVQPPGPAGLAGGCRSSRPIKGRLLVRIASARNDVPLSELQQKA